MPRIRLTPLESYPFSTDLQVRFTDLNYGGHLGNDRLLSLIQEARAGFLAHHGLSEVDFCGVSLIQSDAAVVYRKEAFAGDILTFEVSAGEPSRSGFRLFYRVTRDPGSDLIALVETGMVCFCYISRKIAQLPEAANQIFQERRFPRSRPTLESEKDG